MANSDKKAYYKGEFSELSGIVDGKLPFFILQIYTKKMIQGFISGKKNLAAYLDCGLNKVNLLISKGIPKMYDGNGFVFKVDDVDKWYEEYLKTAFPIKKTNF